MKLFNIQDKKRCYNESLIIIVTEGLTCLKVDVGSACVNRSIWQAPGQRAMYLRGYRAVHLAPEPHMTYLEARDYCRSIGGVMPNYFTYEVERNVNSIPQSQM